MRLCFIILFQNIFLYAQSEPELSLQIIDANICFNKKNSALNFSYYFENHSDKHLVIIDYYEPCGWETGKLEDTVNTLGLILVIRDDEGNIVTPTWEKDTAAMLRHEQYVFDSTGFFENYESIRSKNYLFHTRSLRPKDVLMNLYNVRLNRRKCFYKSTFHFDYNRKYTVSLHYVAKEDVAQLINKSVLGKEDELFVGELRSNQVNLCFK